MPANMPDRNITVKNEYSCQDVALAVHIGNYMPMKNMAAIREARGLTQEDLSERTGLGQSYLSKIESGGANPTLKNIMIIAQALKVEPAELFVLSDLKKRVLAAIASIDDPAQIEAALVVLEAMSVGQK